MQIAPALWRGMTLGIQQGVQMRVLLCPRLPSDGWSSHVRTKLLPSCCLAEAVKAAVSGWGERQLDELEAEERLAFACEKAPTSDPVIEKASPSLVECSL